MGWTQSWGERNIGVDVSSKSSSDHCLSPVAQLVIFRSKQNAKERMNERKRNELWRNTVVSLL